ncbi:helix-turn-helix transcriptional regulator [Methyloglobulus sp.]|uniref:helix-turn-helix transcriptional regulator n=1 Tax=Methyloglobulus sp. TaxID=2518622 RepID=UPI003989F373
MPKQRTYSKYAQEAAILLSEQIKLGRKKRKWSERNLADRAGISRATLQKIENGPSHLCQLFQDGMARRLRLREVPVFAVKTPTSMTNCCRVLHPGLVIAPLRCVR